MTLHRLFADVMATLRDHWRPLVAYHLFFTLLAATLLLPASASSLAALLRRIGRPVLTNDQLLAVALSPVGLVWVLAVVVFTFLILFLQQAGMLLITAHPGGNRYRMALDASWGVVQRFIGLATLTLIKVGAQLLLVLPFVLILVWLYEALLGGYESYYVTQAKPRELWWFLLAAALLALSWLWLAARLYLRWALALPALMLERLSARQALARSRALTHGVKARLSIPVAIPLTAILLLPTLVTALFDTLVTPMLQWLPERVSVLIPAMLIYLTLYGLLALAGTFVGVAFNSMLVGCLYLRLAHRQPKPSAPTKGSHPGWIAWGAEALVLVFALYQASSVLNSFEIRDRVQITAHRGSSMKAPENTLAAIEEAISDGADYVEIDVRLTADGEVVLSHDNSLRRLTGLDQDIDEMTLAEVKEVDVGSWFGDTFAGQPIPTLDEVLRLTRDRIKLYIELKPAPGDMQALVAAVIDRLPESRQDDVIVASLSPQVVREVKRQAPHLKTTLFAQFVVRGGLDITIIDALGLRHNRVTPESAAIAHRLGYQLHAWTVNSRSEMSRMIDLGVDNIITDRPDMLAEVLAERDTLNDGELLLVKLRNWLHS
ncbi:glycerophosphodiester phosphodiesterase family protein [Halomonas sp. BBD45]|uniref:glycerophosphodiester phosphodiesterase family protein n=1 Tax=Halomonas sp. BBD45 TaxID=1904451 RepID=UPI0020A0BE49|nr:glycerophosphodiester phosphodiesterase family protein [Halomonas sp. BBD45]MCP1359432.1 glycerophosphoryl diester phosphodiesterase membrane domain-containing protein [Halomonas sp. BBD45]